MIQKLLAWIQIFVLIAGGLIAWGKLSQRMDDFEKQAQRQHDEIMQQISQENARILAIETQVFRVYNDTAPNLTQHHNAKKAPKVEPQ